MKIFYKVLSVFFLVVILSACQSIPNYKGRELSLSDLPQGSYIRTCSDCIINSGILACSCRTSDQLLKMSEIAYKNCPNPAAYLQNCNGVLSCTANCHALPG